MNSMYYLSISHRYADGHTSMDTIYINGADNAAAWVAWTTSEDPAADRVDVYPAHWDPNGRLVWGGIRAYAWDWSDGHVTAADVKGALGALYED